MVGQAKSRVRIRKCKYGAIALIVLLLPLLWGRAAEARSAARVPDPRAVAHTGFIETLVVDDFSAPGPGPWEQGQGSNVVASLAFGQRLAGVPGRMARVTARQKHPGGKPEENWFALSRPVPADPAWREAEGVKLVLTPERRQPSWWVQVDLSCGDHVYKSPGVRWSYGDRLIVRYLPFSVFLDKDGHAVDPAQVTAIGLEGGATGNALYLRRFSLYRTPPQTGWLTFETNAVTNNIFERTQPVELIFHPGGTPPTSATGFRYVVADYYGRRVATGTVAVKAGADEYRRQVAAGPGYYEVRAYWVDGNAKKLSPYSCLKSAGTVPPGRGTFAVMPHTRAENAARFAAWGRHAFLGIHGDFLNEGDLIGLAWRLDYSRWEWLEPQRPDRSYGEPAWVRTALAEPPFPPYRLAILGFMGPTPAWAVVKGRENRPVASTWADWEAAFRDYIRVKKHQYPNLKPRLYDVMWEPNLTPSYTAKDIVEVYRHARKVLKQEDPEAWLIGPNADTIAQTKQWYEDLFRAGLLNYLDAIGTHTYHSPPPEAAHVVQDIADFKALIRKYHHGKDLPIYCPEMGYQGELGPELVDQARWLMRVITIYKGEGLRAYLPFYGIDYGGLGTADGGFGFCFNLQVEGPNPWGTTRISPKPVVSALAAWVDQLEGTTVLRRLHFPDQNIWGYAFEKAGKPVLALWTTGARKTVRLAAGPGPAEQVDIMGYRTRLKPMHGAVQVEVGPDITYVRGALPAGL